MPKLKSALLWVLAFTITIASAIYQKTTGPTHSTKDEIRIENTSYNYELIHSHGGDNNAAIIIKVPEPITGELVYKRYKSDDQLKTITMSRNGDELVAYLPHQAPAGKLEYTAILINGTHQYHLSASPIVIRFKGAVPLGVLIPHILFMFMAMLVSTRTGIEVIAKGKKTYKYTRLTLVCLFLGGLILGPIVQHYAFGAYWTGWPLGGDWTDNKTIISFIFWLIAYFILRHKPQNRLWPILATLVLFAVYLIPHSLGGSELDHETGKITTGIKE